MHKAAFDHFNKFLPGQQLTSAIEDWLYVFHACRDQALLFYDEREQTLEGVRGSPV
ncbi:hypothetical protein PDO_4408 [Rhizobium sp. PDO1-076]|nr:hypothetical protein PDO_4408 [Rhizobium sp. PDO1-076]